MKQFRKIILSILVLALVFTLTDITTISNPVAAHAATMKISDKTLSLKVGQTAKLSISSTKATVKWSTKDKKIATVSAKGKVTAIAAGTTKITATVAGKKFYCNVTVKEVPNPALANAPFKAQEKTIGNINFVMPADWNMESQITDKGIQVTLAPKDTTAASVIALTIIPANKEIAYSEIKAQFSPIYTQSYFDNVYTQKYGASNFTVTNITQSDFSSNIGNVLKTQYTLTLNQVPLIQQIYDFSIGSLFIEICSGNSNGTDLSTIIEYTINSVIIK